MEVGVLVCQLPSCGLGPHHEGVHWALDMRLALLPALAPGRCGHERPVVALQDVGDRLLDLSRKAEVLGAQPGHEIRTVLGAMGRERARNLYGQLARPGGASGDAATTAAGYAVGEAAAAAAVSVAHCAVSVVAATGALKHQRAERQGDGRVVTVLSLKRLGEVSSGRPVGCRYASAVADAVAVAVVAVHAAVCAAAPCTRGSTAVSAIHVSVLHSTCQTRPS